jgi:GT2 family glycosyltransferase
MQVADGQHVAGAAGAPPDPYDADVVILAMDRPEETRAAIVSALAQLGVTRHVFVVDQGSTPENLAALAATVADRPDATLVRLDRNFGVAGGRNRGTALGHGRVIVALDNDAEFATPDTLAQAVAALADAPDLAAVGFRIVVHSTGADDVSSWGYPASLLPRAGDSFDAVTFVGAGHAIRRADWDAAGGYDEALFFAWEEYDFCLRAIALGRRIRYRGDIVVRHKVASEHRFAWGGTRAFFFVRNRLYIARKWGASWPALAPRIGGYVLRGLRNGVLRQTLRAIPAAAALARAHAAPAAMPPAGRAYLAANDAAHRGSLLGRLRREVLAALPRAPR